MPSTLFFDLRPKPVEENSLLLLFVPLPQPVPSAACDRDILCLSFSLATELWITWFVVGRGSEGGS